MIITSALYEFARPVGQDIEDIVDLLERQYLN
jgi:hypothetical protein